MKVLEKKILRGPNYWSITFEKLIVLTLDIETLEKRPTDTIPGFADRLEEMFPGMYEDRCSLGVAGGFFQRVIKGTWMGHVVEHISLELQSLAGMKCGFGRTRGTGKKGIYNVVFEYEDEEAGLFAGLAAIKICDSLINGIPYNLQKDIDELKRIRNKKLPDPFVQDLIKEAEKRYIPWSSTDQSFILGTGNRQKKISLDSFLQNKSGVVTKEISGKDAHTLIENLFPKGTETNIPIVAITGTNGKTTTVRLVAQLFRKAGFKTGYTTTDGIFLDEKMLEKGDCSGPKSARNVLKNPNVEAAVLECARGGIIREGLGFDACDIAIVTNVEADHLGLKGIDTLEDLAKVKSVVPETVKRRGYAILNADDDLVYKMRENVNCKTAFFSIQKDNERIKEHLAAGRLCGVLEDDQLVIYDGKKRYILGGLKEIPLTFGGKALFMVQNILPAALSAFISKIDVEIIKNVLSEFDANPENTPGRMNFFDFKKFNIMVDYFHNPAGIIAIGKFLKLYKAPYNIGIIAAAGDRRDEDIIELGRLAGEIFDEIIIRTDVDPRGRAEGDVERLLEEGVRISNKKMKTYHIPDEEDSLNHAIKIAREGCLITLSSETVLGAVEIINRLKADHIKENNIVSTLS